MLYRYQPGKTGTAMLYQDDGTYITTVPLSEVSPGLYYANEMDADYVLLQFDDGYTDYVFTEKITVTSIQEKPVLSEREA